MSLWILFIAASCVYGIAGCLLLWKIPFCEGGDLIATNVSVIIPARNEEKRIPVLLASLKRETRALAGKVRIQVIVADDDSTDRTREIASEYGCLVLRAEAGDVEEGKEEGRAGKSAACHRGAAAAEGDYLVFLDADTRFEDGGFGKILAAYKGGLLSVQPFHEMKKTYETLSSFFNIVVMAGVNAFTPFSKTDKPFGCFGPCLVCSRNDYAAVGGHKAIIDELVDDIALSRLFMKCGYPVRCLGGKGSIRFRMYPGGPKELLEGWTKNMATAAGMSAPIINVLLFVWIAGMANLFLAFSGVFGLGAPVPAALTFFVYALYCLQVFFLLQRIAERPLLPCLFFPVYMAFFIGLFFYSVFKTRVVKAVTWRGRIIRLKPGRKR